MLLFIAEPEAEEAAERLRRITGLNDSNVVITASLLTATISPHSLRSE